MPQSPKVKVYLGNAKCLVIERQRLFQYPKGSPLVFIKDVVDNGPEIGNKTVYTIRGLDPSITTYCTSLGIQEIGDELGANYQNILDIDAVINEFMSPPKASGPKEK